MKPALPGPRAEVAARPGELRVLAVVLRRAGAEAAWLRRRIDAAQDRARVDEYSKDGKHLNIDLRGRISH